MRGGHEPPKPASRLRRTRARALPKHVGRSRLVLTLIARSLFSSGITVIAVAVVAQEQPPQPALSAAGSLGPSLVSAVAPSSPAGVDGDRAQGDPLADAVAVLPPSPPIAIDVPAIGVHSRLQHLA